MNLRVISAGELEFNGKVYRCATGKNGFTQDKKEGDNCTPIGTFALRECWWRADKLPDEPVTKLKLKRISADDGWCDAPNNTSYNKHIKLPFNASHEKLCRDDAVYDIIVPLGYNDDPIIRGKGSAIFLHVAKPDYSGTEGCVALSLDDLLKILDRITPDSKIEIHPKM